MTNNKVIGYLVAGPKNVFYDEGEEGATRQIFTSIRETGGVYWWTNPEGIEQPSAKGYWEPVYLDFLLPFRAGDKVLFTSDNDSNLPYNLLGVVVDNHNGQPRVDFGRKDNDIWTVMDYELKHYTEEGVEADDQKTEPEYTGGSVNYYKVQVDNPTTEGNSPYLAECNDIIEALGMNYAEGNAFKALWRRAAARQGVQKKGYTDGLYDAEKVVFFGQRLVEQEKAKKE